MSGFFGPVSGSTSSTSTNARLGSRLPYVSPTGGAVAANPAIIASTGRLIVTLPAGNATWASLTAGGADGQLLEVVNADAANTLTLPASVFIGATGVDLTLPPGGRVLLYYDLTDTAWERTSP